MKSNEHPFKECSTCKTLGDCPEPDIEDNLLGTPTCPPECPRPISILRTTYNKRKQNKYVSNINRDL